MVGLGDIPEDVTVLKLMRADNDQLNSWSSGSDRIRRTLAALRSLLIEASGLPSGASPLRTAEDVYHAMLRERSTVPTKVWVVWALNEDSSRLLAFSKKGQSRRRYVRWYGPLVPEVSDLPRVPPGGSYLLYRNGAGPGILRKPGVVEKLRALVEAAPIRDVLLKGWDQTGRLVLHSAAASGTGYVNLGSGSWNTLEPEPGLWGWWSR